jgi:ABC-type transport system involved in cytochrome bd biosynthesis fused ATPase/permease subunit
MAESANQRVIPLGGFAVFMQLDRVRRSNFKHMGSIRTDIKRIPAHKSEADSSTLESETASRMSSATCRNVEIERQVAETGASASAEGFNGR